MKINKKDAIRIITEAAKKYEECLNNNTFLIVYEKLGIQEYVEISFRDMFFLHLTGITTKLSAQRFYKACIANKLSDSDIKQLNICNDIVSISGLMDKEVL